MHKKFQVFSFFFHPLLTHQIHDRKHERRSHARNGTARAPAAAAVGALGWASRSSSAHEIRSATSALPVGGVRRALRALVPRVAGAWRPPRAVVGCGAEAGGGCAAGGALTAATAPSPGAAVTRARLAPPQRASPLGNCRKIKRTVCKTFPLKTFRKTLREIP